MNISSIWHIEKPLGLKSLPSRRTGNRYLIPCLTIVWAGLILSVMGVLWSYQTTPGAVSHSPTQWPAESQTTWNAFRPTLVMFAHPRCPCTRASISELEQIMAYGPERLDARVEFYKPANFPQDWEKTDLWKATAAIPGVTVNTDLDGQAARLFGATTSGYVALYDTRGELVFHGGITGSRGHTGANRGSSAVLDYLSQGNSESQQTYTFGCPLLGRDETCRQDQN
ncbi:hypothetical protein [Gimesia chilikensis]|uniref:hypothetical protein n=1 Tax=Gimesia chilikensis TaxID=2605989 RepID=UPI00118CA707|nr:hypothetical protein [Gimesia chilikensis]QDT82743.1 hypothetical protein MalM14_03720 [Gimesia chilikensis]